MPLFFIFLWEIGRCFDWNNVWVQYPQDPNLKQKAKFLFLLGDVEDGKILSFFIFKVNIFGESKRSEKENSTLTFWWYYSLFIFCDYCSRFSNNENNIVILSKKWCIVMSHIMKMPTYLTMMLCYKFYNGFYDILYINIFVYILYKKKRVMISGKRAIIAPLGYVLFGRPKN